MHDGKRLLRMRQMRQHALSASEGVHGIAILTSMLRKFQIARCVVVSTPNLQLQYALLFHPNSFGRPVANCRHCHAALRMR